MRGQSTSYGKNQDRPADHSDGPSTALLILVYGLYALVFPLLIIDFVAERIANLFKRNPSVAGATGSIFSFVWYLKFLRPTARRRMFVRASIATPAQYLDTIPGEKVISGDTRVERQHRGQGWDDRRREIYRRDDYTCQVCGVRGGSDGEDIVLQADHIVPVSRGGEDDPDNLRTLCITCHQARHARLF